MKIYDTSAVGVAAMLRCCQEFTYLEIDSRGRFVFNGPDDDELFQSFAQTYKDFCTIKDRWRFQEKFKGRSSQ